MVILHRPERCARCQCPLDGADGQPQRHQVTDIPAVKPRVTEYQRHRLVCTVCGAVTRAEWPAGVPRGGFGPRVQAITAWWTGAYHRSRRTTQRVLEDLCGIAIGLGTVANLEQATAQALAEPVAEARTSGQRSRPRIWTRPGGVKAGNGPGCGRPPPRASPSLSSGCRAAPRGPRNSWGSGFGAIWGRIAGVPIPGTLRTWYPAWRRQGCGAHLLRDIEVMIERGGPSPAIGEALRAQARPRCHWWHRVRDGTLAPTTFARDMWPVRQEVERVLDAGQTCGVPKTEGACRAILTRRQALWTCVRHPEVEPTNNAAERAIRPGVLWRQGRFGTQSPEGSRVVETMMTAVATLTPQHRNILDDVIAACEAARRHQPAPS